MREENIRGMKQNIVLDSAAVDALSASSPRVQSHIVLFSNIYSAHACFSKKMHQRKKHTPFHHQPL